VPMLDGDGGTIVNVIAVVGRGFPGIAHTSAARAGVLELSRSLAFEWGPKVRINCVAPGPVQTEAFEHTYHPDIFKLCDALPIPRFGRPELDWPQRIAKITRTRLVDPESGREFVEPHRAGEMQIRGPVVFDGYFAAPEITARSFTADGWFRTGDLFEIDASGRYYQFVGRLKQLINRGGVKISPDEIDAVLAEHPDVAEGAVVGYPDDVLGERICAVVAPKAGRTVTVETLQDHFRSRELAVFKWPERVRLVERLPRNPLGKVIRGEVARIAAATQQPLP